MTAVQISGSEAIEEKARKDFEFYKGLELLVSMIDMAPDGLLELDDRVPVIVTEYRHTDFNEGYADSSWGVQLTEKAITAIRQHMKESEYCAGYVQSFEVYLALNTLDSCIRGIVYSLDATGRIESHYRDWN